MYDNNLSALSTGERVRLIGAGVAAVLLACVKLGRRQLPMNMQHTSDTNHKQC